MRRGLRQLVSAPLRDTWRGMLASLPVLVMVTGFPALEPDRLSAFAEPESVSVGAVYVNVLNPVMLEVPDHTATWGEAPLPVIVPAPPLTLRLATPPMSEKVHPEAQLIVLARPREMPAF